MIKLLLYSQLLWVRKIVDAEDQVDHSLSQMAQNFRGWRYSGPLVNRQLQNKYGLNKRIFYMLHVRLVLYMLHVLHLFLLTIG